MRIDFARPRRGGDDQQTWNYTGRKRAKSFWSCYACELPAVIHPSRRSAKNTPCAILGNRRDHAKPRRESAKRPLGLSCRSRNCLSTQLLFGELFSHSNASQATWLRLFSNDLAVLRNIDRRAVHACGLAGALGRASEGAANRRGEFFASLWFGFSFHGDLSNNFGVLPELSYTVHSSAKSRYDFSKLIQLRVNRRNTSLRGTLWPPCLTRVEIRRSASCGDEIRRYTISIRQPTAFQRSSRLM
jgi:hypothetical protein